MLPPRHFIAVLLLALAGLRPNSARADPKPPTDDIANKVRAVFAAKCTACHGSDLRKPKGQFGYVLDLKRIAENPEMVIPGEPKESELWVLVQRSEMPPAESSHGPLTPEQKELIRTWIAAGAPDAPAGHSALKPLRDK